ncbi:sulfotransferase family 2 domain-containing protein [Ruegeria arenilitoris]|uniref:sulfotransferase family 2 domain-containing protein n=1 Tax=Ruegeria arenilitoris TaxID=1173585 RepID=UPI0014813720
MNESPAMVRKTNFPCSLQKCGCQTSSFIWVSKRKKVIYFETPKAACSSIKDHLGISQAKTFADRCRSWRYGFKMLTGVTPLEAIEMHPGYFSFTVVRDPVARTISNYSMFTQSGHEFREQQIEEVFGKPFETIDFPEFCKSLGTRSNHHWAPYVEYLPIKDGKVQIDYICRMENLSTDWAIVAQKIGCSPTLPRANKSKSVKIHPAKQDLENIAAHFSEDYRLLGYEHPV